jgi:mannopine transport system permease protein
MSAALDRFRHASSARMYSPMLSVLLVLPVLLVLVLVFYLPIGRLLATSVFDPAPTVAHYERIATTPLYTTILVRTLRTALIVTVLTLVLAYPVAYLMSRLVGWRLALLAALVSMPLWTSVLVRSFAWTVLLRRNGLVNDGLQAIGVTDEPLRLLYTEGAVWLAMTHILLPFQILPIYATLRGISPDLGRAAQSLGAGPASVFLRVTLPLSLPGVAAGSVLVFILSLGFFITPALVGGPQSMMISTLIGQQVTQLFNWPFAAAIAAVLLTVTLLIVLAFQRFLRFDRVLGGDAS